MSRRSFDLVIQQREDLMKVYREVYVKCHSQQEAWRKTIQHPAPRFYVSPDQAYRIVSPLIRGDRSRLEKCQPHIQRMYLAMFEELKRMSQQKEFIRKPLRYICQFLVARPAPEFYITETYMRITFHYCKRFGKEYHRKYFDKSKN